MRRFLVFLCAMALVSAGVGTASATLITFDDQLAFLNATGAVSNGAYPNLGLTTSPYTLHNITFSLAGGSTELYVGTGGTTDWTTHLSGNTIALSGTEDMDVVVSSAQSVFAVGFDFVELESDPDVSPGFVDSTFTVTLRDGVIDVGAFTFNAPNDVAAFVGAWTDVGFDTMEIRETTGTNENEIFGQFYIGTTGTTPVPEPCTMLLLGAGLAGIGLFGRKRLRK